MHSPSSKRAAVARSRLVCTLGINFSCCCIRQSKLSLLKRLFSSSHYSAKAENEVRKTTTALENALTERSQVRATLKEAEKALKISERNKENAVASVKKAEIKYKEYQKKSTENTKKAFALKKQQEKKAAEETKKAAKKLKEQVAKAKQKAEANAKREKQQRDRKIKELKKKIKQIEQDKKKYDKDKKVNSSKRAAALLEQQRKELQALKAIK